VRNHPNMIHSHIADDTIVLIELNLFKEYPMPVNFLCRTRRSDLAWAPSLLPVAVTCGSVSLMSIQEKN
jgi:hypothetical protein